jgi:hypothetical protein
MGECHQDITRVAAIGIAIGILANVVGFAGAQPTSPVVVYSDQGWSATDRDTFYITSQGSRMMPYTWFKALRRADSNELFAADQLQRYGYLPNERSKSNPEGLPIGFVIDGNAATGDLGMTCAACHTAQLEYQKDGKTYALRLDGAPANADFHQFLADLTAAARATSTQPDRFHAFAMAVLGNGYSTAKVVQLKTNFDAWVKQFGEFMDNSLPALPWGPGRLDALGMIFNRVAGRDLGLDANFKVADAPVSYPFLWNAPQQDHTQWNGGVPNGLYIQGLGRNTGEVYGVFADFKPKKNLVGIDYRKNSADFAGLQTLEEKVVALKPPKWPSGIWPIKGELLAHGKDLYDANCGSCHGVTNSTEVLGAWTTPIKAVGTDPKMVNNAERMSDSGLLAGSLMPPPPLGATLANPAKTHDILANAVVGSLFDEAFSIPITPNKIAHSGVWVAVRKDVDRLFPGENIGNLFKTKLTIAKTIEIQTFLAARLRGKILERFNDVFRKPASADPGAAYESRVLSGIWATAPYLHNGSVPNLWELLTPAKQRKGTFMVGSRTFDPQKVGYDTEHSPSKNAVFVADLANANGNGNGGHEYGTDLSEADRWAIIEYMKTM